MNRTMITATNTLGQLQKQMDSISHNMANVQTSGYKRRETTFTDLLVQEFQNQPNTQKEEGRVTPNGIRQGTGARLAQTKIIMTQGSIKSTNRSLDTAFTKEGQFYKVLVQDENRSSVQYTRDGALYLSPISDEEVMLVNGQGYPLLDENDQPIYLKGQPEQIEITQSGTLNVQQANGEAERFYLGVVQVNQPQFLEQKGENLLGMPNNLAELGLTENEIVSELVGEARMDIAIQQRALEQSNVDLSKEMTDLLNAQRSYQFQSKSITMADQMMGLVNGIR